MNRKLSLLTLSSFLALGTVGCTKGSSPTEPAAFDLEDSAVAASSVSGDSDKRRGGDDDRNDDNGSASNNRRRGRGQDDAPGDDRGRRGRGGRGRGGDDNRPNNPNTPNNPRPAGQEFEAAVTSVQGSTLVLANGTRVVVNGQTQWSNRGDLFNLNQVSGAVAANRPVRAEGRGTRQDNGAILANTLKVEVDD
ncbi:MAG TPA: hypothetical protein VG477_08775 [Thermoanaerobaculia bacterium]|nr:hypothetical protein [Thermoanaerobaculia bacterium]